MKLILMMKILIMILMMILMIMMTKQYDLADDTDDYNDHQNDEDDEDIGIIAANFPHTIIRAKNTIIRAPEFLLQSGVCTMTLPFGQTLGGACSFFIIIDNPYDN